VDPNEARKRFIRTFVLKVLDIVGMVLEQQTWN
jgi:hypothetical protein